MTQPSDKSPRPSPRQERPDWDSMILQILYALPGRSQDPRTTHSAVIVSPDHSIVSTGYNSLPRGFRLRSRTALSNRGNIFFSNTRNETPFFRPPGWVMPLWAARFTRNRCRVVTALEPSSSPVWQSWSYTPITPATRKSVWLGNPIAFPESCWTKPACACVFWRAKSKAPSFCSMASL